MDELTARLYDALIALDRPAAEALFEDASRQFSPLQAAEQLIVPALARMGHEWNAGQLALSQIYMASRICEDIVTRVLPPMAPERKSQPRHAIVVLSNYHMLGKRIVLSVMRASGFDTIDFGQMEVDEVVERVIAEDVKILLVSVLLLPAALKVKAVREALVARDRQVRIVVGGAPFQFDPQLWQEIGADAMGRNAAEAVAIVGKWMEEMS